MFRLLLACILFEMVAAFAPIASSPIITSSPLHMMDVTSMPDIASTGMILAETEAWVQPLALVLDPFLNLLSFAMVSQRGHFLKCFMRYHWQQIPVSLLLKLCRVVLSWYPTTNVNELPWNIVAWPTEPLLRAIRGAVPPAFGVDITPIVWLGVFTFLHEILLGQQGLLTMKLKYGI